LLESDNEWNLLFDEAIVSASAYQLRHLFVTVVLFFSVSDVRALFDKYWLYFVDEYINGYEMHLQTQIMLCHTNN